MTANHCARKKLSELGLPTGNCRKFAHEHGLFGHFPGAIPPCRNKRRRYIDPDAIAGRMPRRLSGARPRVKIGRTKKGIKMKSLKLSLLAAVGCLALAGAAQAADRPLGLTFNAGAATDYEFRGVSQTNNQPEIFAGADVTLGKIGYAGTWLSNIDFGDSADTEYDLYAGIKPVLGPVTFDFGAIRYGYTKDHNDWSYWEFKAAGSIPAGPATVGVAFFYSPDITGPSKADSYYYELNGSLPIKDTKFSVSGAVGRQAYQGAGDYTTWNAGVGYAVTDSVGLDFRYWDTDEHSFGKIYGGKFVAGLKATF